MFSKRFSVIATFLILLSAMGQGALCQQQMDLDDLEIKGELLGDNRIQMINREKNKLKNFVEFRTDYRNEITEGLIIPTPRYSDMAILKSNQKKK
ncbi:MAG: hypothetical protein AAF202_02435 [Pseudomonadota bacterium]